MRLQPSYQEVMESLISDLSLALTDAVTFDEARARVWFVGAAVRSRIVIRVSSDLWVEISLDSDILTDLEYSLIDLRDAAFRENLKPVREVQLRLESLDRAGRRGSELWS